MSEPLVSAIVPIYNKERYLAECVESLVGQTLRDIEIILVDDGSTDGSGEICRSFARKDSRIKVLEKENSGVSASRNAGLEMASGKYVAFVDADDACCEDMLERLAARAEQTGADIVFADIYTYAGDGTLTPCNRHITRELDYATRSDIDVFQRKLLIKGMKQYRPYFNFGGQALSRLYRRDTIAGLRFIEGLSYGEDGIFNLYALQRSKRVIRLPEALYKYRILQGSLSHGYNYNRTIVSQLERVFRETQAFADAYKQDDELFRRGVEVRIATWTNKCLSMYYFTREYMQGKRFSQVCGEIRALLDREPYRSALQKADLSLMRPEEKLYVFVMRRRMLPAAYLLVNGREVLKRLKKH